MGAHHVQESVPGVELRFSYEDYELFYEDTFVPMKVSQEQLLIQPEGIEAPDIEETGTQTEGDGPEGQTDDGAEEEDDILPGKPAEKKQVEDFDFGDDFW